MVSTTSNNFLANTHCIIINNLVSFRISFTIHTDNVTEIDIYSNRKLKNLFVLYCLGVHYLFVLKLALVSTGFINFLFKFANLVTHLISFWSLLILALAATCYTKAFWPDRTWKSIQQQDARNLWRGNAIVGAKVGCHQKEA